MPAPAYSGTFSTRTAWWFWNISIGYTQSSFLRYTMGSTAEVHLTNGGWFVNTNITRPPPWYHHPVPSRRKHWWLIYHCSQRVAEPSLATGNPFLLSQRKAHTFIPSRSLELFGPTCVGFTFFPGTSNNSLQCSVPTINCKWWHLSFQI